MKTLTFAEVIFSIGPFGTTDVVECRDRSKEVLDEIKKQYGDDLLSVVFYTVYEIDHMNLKFRSQPTEQEQVFKAPQEKVEEKLEESTKGLVQSIKEMILGSAETEVPKNRTLH